MKHVLTVLLLVGSSCARPAPRPAWSSGSPKRVPCACRAPPTRRTSSG